MYLTISVLSFDVSALVFNSEWDNCSVSKDCEPRCYFVAWTCITIVDLIQTPLFFHLTVLLDQPVVCMCSTDAPTDAYAICY